MKLTQNMIGASIALSLIGSTNAATIAGVGSVIDDSGSEVTEWRTASTVKSLDADGDNVYGTFGGIAFGDAVFGAMGFVTSQGQVGPFGGYATIDDTTIGDPDRQVVTTTNGGTAGTDVVMYTFVVNTAVAAGEVMRVGIGLDGLNGAQFSPATIGLVELGGGGGTAEVSVAASNNALIDMYFFDVTGGVTAGTQFQVIADTGTGDFATHQLVSLDVMPVPEPSSTALLGLGGLALIMRRRK